MIKSLFGEEGPPRPKEEKFEESLETEESIKRQLDELNLSLTETPPEQKFPAATDAEIEQAFSSIFTPPQSENTNESFRDFSQDERQSLPELDEEFAQDRTLTPPANEVFMPNAPLGLRTETQTAPEKESIAPTPEPADKRPQIFRTETKPLTTAETIRQSGMAWSAAIGLFGSVVFMLILGWFFDVLTGASPWGIVVGIIIGAVIGFYQFFKVTSRIFK